LECMDIFKQIVGGQNIADYMGYNYHHMCRDIIPEMKQAGLMFKHGNNQSSKLVTTPLLINIYYILRQVNKTNARDKAADET